MTKPRRGLVLAVIDGLTPSILEAGLADRRLPTLSALSERGVLGRGVSTFPSLTPVCLSSIATGAHGDKHGIPHLVWWHRGERRVVEYGSSFSAVRAAGVARTLRDTLVGLNAEHLDPSALTVFERLSDAGLQTAAVNFTAYRGRTPHRSPLPLLGTVFGPEHFFFYNLFASSRTGAPLSFRSRSKGTIDQYATAVGRWLVTRDSFDFLLFYLSDYDYASHSSGPDTAFDVLVRCDTAIGQLVAAVGSVDEFLERYAMLVVADHGQTAVDDVAILRDHYRHDDGVFVGSSNRAAGIYRTQPNAPAARVLAQRLDPDPAVEVTVFVEDGVVIARREGVELAISESDGELVTQGDTTVLDHPDAVARVWAAARCPNAGEVIVSAAPGWEFADLGGGHHRGGGSHGSLTAGDSVVPVLGVGVPRLPTSIVEIADVVCEALGVGSERPQPLRAGQATTLGADGR